MTFPKVNIGGVTIHNVTMQEALRAVDVLVRRGKPSYLTTPNVDMIARCQHDPEFMQYHEECALALADGVPVLWAGKFLGTPIKEKVSGSDFVPLVCKMANEEG